MGKRGQHIEFLDFKKSVISHSESLVNWMVPLLLLVIHTQESVLTLLYFYINVVIYV